MKKLRRVTKKWIREQFGGRHDFRWIRRALHDYRAWYEVEISADEFARLIMISSPLSPRELLSNEWPLMRQTLSEIAGQSDFFDRTENLNGQQVKRVVDQLDVGHTFAPCFIIQRTRSMPKQGSYYIVDGMHRLTAYGLHSKLMSQSVPLVFYCGTRRRRKKPRVKKV